LKDLKTKCKNKKPTNYKYKIEKENKIPSSPITPKLHPLIKKK